MILQAVCFWRGANPRQRSGPAVSGGADSVCCSTSCTACAGEIPFTLAAAHYNHQLRGG